MLTSSLCWQKERSRELSFVKPSQVTSLPPKWYIKLLQPSAFILSSLHSMTSQPQESEKMSSSQHECIIEKPFVLRTSFLDEQSMILFKTELSHEYEQFDINETDKAVKSFEQGSGLMGLILRVGILSSTRVGTKLDLSSQSDCLDPQFEEDLKTMLDGYGAGT